MIVGVDTGGTKTLIALFSANGEILDSLKFATPKDKQQYINLVVRGINKLTNIRNVNILSMAIPGVIKNQKIVVCQNLDWYDFDLISQLQLLLPRTKIIMKNDAQLGAIGANELLNKKYQRCLYLTISTGVNGALVVDNQLIDQLNISELGDMIIGYDNSFYSWTDLASGAAIFQKYHKYLGELSTEQEFQEVAKRIAGGLLAIIPLFYPDIVAIGGGGGAHYDKFAPALNQYLANLPERYHCPVVLSPKPEEIVAYGCYFNAKNN